MTTRSRAAAFAGAATLALTGSAQAATPESGTADKENPRIEWTGEATGSALQYAHFFYGAQIVDDCVAPVCDSFTLTVGENAQKIVVSAEDATGYTEMQVKDAAGTEVFWSEGVDGGPTVWSKTKPKAGTYTIEVLTDALAPAPADDPSYAASAVFTPILPPPTS